MKQPEAAISVTLLIPARSAAHSLAATTNAAHAFLSREFPDSFEIILIPNDPDGETATVDVARKMEGQYPEVRSATLDGPPGKGTALRSGFRLARGQMIFFTDADLPYDLEFFSRAARELSRGADFVTGNRRLDESQFNLPVDLLPVAHGRHRLGLAFNGVVRRLFGVTTTDTQAGIKAMTREMADAAFGDQVCAGFFFDLEFFLTARGRGFRHRELPVILRLETEKSTVRVVRESIQAAYWLSRIFMRNLLGRYGRLKAWRVASFYGSESPSNRLFLEARWRLTPYSDMERELPAAGRVLDLGCGHGLFSFALASRARRRSVVGVDHDANRIETAKRALAKAPSATRIQFQPGSALDPPPGPFSGITLIDVMHYFPLREQALVFQKAFENLEPGGVLLVREVNPAGGWISRVNQAYERLATSTGFTRSEQKSALHFRKPSGWMSALSQSGFQVRQRPCSSPLFADILFIATKPTRETRT